jgi:hypothetical protein
MKLLNFAIDSSIELTSDGLIWDLHNCGNFEGLDLLVDQNSVLMKWTEAYPWSGHGNNFSGVNLFFRDLYFLEIGARDDELPLTEDTCVAELFQVTPEGRDKDPRLRSLHEWTNDFHIFFRFRGGRTIEIGSRTVQLIPVL